MDHVRLGMLAGVLLFLIFLSGFFSAAEISLMTVNRYRLRHLAESGHRGARLARRLLRRPDRVLGVVLLGNNFGNIAASSVATLMAVRLYGAGVLALVTGVLTLVILIVSEVAPKTLAALYPEPVAFGSAYVLTPLLRVVYPLVAAVNFTANHLLRAFGVSVKPRTPDQMGAEELRAVVLEAGSLIPTTHRAMLLAILDLEKSTVEDVMVPRREVEGIDLEADWDEIVDLLGRSHYTRLPVFHGSLDNVIGMLHVRRALHLALAGRLTRDSLKSAALEPYYIPQGTPLATQLMNFKTMRRHIGLVVDEYGDLMGLVTLEEILEEIVGEFTTQAPGTPEDIFPQPDGSFLINGSTSIRDINRTLGWQLPLNGPKTLNGLITEYLEDIPSPGTSLLLNGYLVDIVRTRGTAIQVARLRVHAVAAPKKHDEDE
ncbi:HlyC/CorC family transporter [Acidiferrobacter sp.]|uniref:HlyC/CorC family transporter n=1 Tax=Acidiferrobacter sp. TaxID=1872107 RepID=UPI0026143F20|nr:HlyC/CorC family transporter [Acidiferrobacter sp.]